MKKKLAAIILFYLSSSLHAACFVKDDTHQTLHLQKPALRIISLAPDATEILFAIGAGSHVAGVMQGSDYPPPAKKIAVVGSYSGIDLEKIISLKPDLIVSWGNSFSRPLSLLKKSGVPVYVTNTHTLEDVARTMKNLGCLAGTEGFAQKTAEDYLQKLTLLKNKYRTQKPVTVFYQIGSYSLITINKNSWINQAIHLCGGENIFENAFFTAPEVSWEAVLNANPQVIISDAKEADWKNTWLKWKMITAVNHNNLFSIDPDIIDRAGPRLWQGVEKICGYLAAART